MLKHIISNLFRFAIILIFLTSCKHQKISSDQQKLKDAFSDKFYIGTALSVNQLIGKDSADLQIVKKHFNSIVAENCMKAGELQSKKGEFNFNAADKFVAFGEKNNMFIHGHTLIWHSQLPSWFFIDELGNDVDREELIKRMKNHIQTVVGRYKGRVNSWDVVNEAILDDGRLRESKFLYIIGEDYIKLAFEFAHEADPGAELYYNDYSMANPQKRAGVVNLVKKLQTQGVKIDGIGMQGHLGLNYPSIDEFENSIVTFASLGAKVMVTELDLTVLPSPLENAGADIAKKFEYKKEMNPYVDALPDSVNVQFENRYIDLFKLFLKHSEKISRVTFWGVNDTQSWKNNWPVFGRTDYSLLFDRNNQAKNVVYEIINLTNTDQYAN